MGHQGGIARFTGSLGGYNFYFDDDRESVRWKSRLNRKKWLARKEMWRQHDSSRLFGSASIIAGNLWQGMPAGLRRLADGSGYGRLVGRCVSLMGDDGQLWDADLLKGLELNEDALAPSVNFRLRENGVGAGIRLDGLAQLNRELDLALGDKAGTVPASFLVAHGLGPFGLGMKGLKLTAEEARVTTAFRVGGARDQGLGARNRVSGQEDGFRWPLRLRSGQAPASGRIGVRPEAAASNTTTASRPQKQVQRRYRVWVNAVKVAETLWISAQEKFHLDTSHGVGGVGYVTDWEQDFPDSLDLRNPFEGETMEFDGEYVVYCAVEVSEKRGRHWVRLPYCCRFRVVDVVVVASGLEVSEQGSELEFKNLDSAIDESRKPSDERRVRPSTGNVRYLGENGEILIDEEWPKVEMELKVWNSEDSLPVEKLSRRSELMEAMERNEGTLAAFEKEILRSDLVGTDGILFEFKGRNMPWVDIWMRFLGMGPEIVHRLSAPQRGSGMPAGP